jgi:hypothetical protein
MLTRRSFLDFITRALGALGLVGPREAVGVPPEEIYPLFPQEFETFGWVFRVATPLQKSSLVAKHTTIASVLAWGPPKDVNWPTLYDKVMKPRFARLPSGKVVRLIPFEFTSSGFPCVLMASRGMENDRYARWQAIYENAGDLTEIDQSTPCHLDQLSPTLREKLLSDHSNPVSGWDPDTGRIRLVQDVPGKSNATIVGPDSHKKWIEP